jgi:hypothetical protein
VASDIGRGFDLTHRITTTAPDRIIKIHISAAGEEPVKYAAVVV